MTHYFALTKDRALLTITEFLEARIAEDEQHVREVGPYLDDCQECSFGQQPGSPYGHARLIAECAAKRERIQVIQDGWISYNDDNILGVLLALEAIPYATHPDFKEEWAARG